MKEHALTDPIPAPEPVVVGRWWPFTAASTMMLVAACLAFTEVALCVDEDRWLEAALPLSIVAIMVFSTQGEVLLGVALGGYGMLLGAHVYWCLPDWLVHNRLTLMDQNLVLLALTHAGTGGIFGGAIQAVNQRQYLIGLVPPIAYMAFMGFQLQ